MTGPQHRLPPWRPLDVLSAMWSSATVVPMNLLVQGRRLTVKLNETDERRLSGDGVTVDVNVTRRLIPANCQVFTATRN